MSQGATVMFALLSSKPEFNEKIKPFIALAPAVKISNAIRVPVPVLKYNITVPEVVKIPFLRVLNYYLTLVLTKHTTFPPCFLSEDQTSFS